LRKIVLLFGVLVATFAMMATPVLAAKTDTYHYNGKYADSLGYLYGNMYYVYADEDIAVFIWANVGVFVFYPGDFEFHWSMAHATIEFWGFTFEMETYGPTITIHDNFKHKDDISQYHAIYNAKGRLGYTDVFDMGTLAGSGDAIVYHGVINQQLKVF
jgi:hypothetical protein